MGDFRTSTKSTSGATSSKTITLSIVVRYLSLLHGEKNKGTWVLLPSDGHVGVLRDVVSGSEIALFAARIRIVRTDGSAITEGTTTLKGHDRIPKMSTIIGSTVSPDPALLTNQSSKSLSAQVFLPGGTIEAFPPAGFPEHSNIRGDVGLATQLLLTDTVMYSVDLPQAEYQLQVASPRCRVAFVFDSAARFEIINEDLRRRDVAGTDDAAEWAALRGLLNGNFGQFNSDDIWPCPTAQTGDFA